MIKATATRADGKILLVLGLSYENLRRLQEKNEPIAFSLAELGINKVDDVFIFAGETEATMRRWLEEGGMMPRVH